MFGISARLSRFSGLKRAPIQRLATLTDKEGKIDTNLALQRPETLPFVPGIKH